MYLLSQASIIMESKTQNTIISKESPDSVFPVHYVRKESPDGLVQGVGEVQVMGGDPYSPKSEQCSPSSDAEDDGYGTGTKRKSRHLGDEFDLNEYPLDADGSSMDPFVVTEKPHPNHEDPCLDCEDAKNSDEVPSTSRNTMSDRQRQTDSGHYSVHDLEDCSDNEYEDSKIQNNLELFPEDDFVDRGYRVSFCDEVSETGVIKKLNQNGKEINEKINPTSDNSDDQPIKKDQNERKKKIPKSQDGDKNVEQYSETSPNIVQEQQYSSPTQTSPVQKPNSNVNDSKNSHSTKNQRPSNIIGDSTKLRSERKQTRFKGTDAKVNAGSTSKVINQSTGGTQGNSQPIKVNNDRGRIDNDQAEMSACASTDPMLHNTEILTGEVISEHSTSRSNNANGGQAAINSHRNANTIDTREGQRQDKQSFDDYQKSTRVGECKRSKSQAGTSVQASNIDSKNSNDDITSYGNERNINRSQSKTVGVVSNKNHQGHSKKNSVENRKHSNDLLQKNSLRTNSLGSDEDGILSYNERSKDDISNKGHKSYKSVKINEGPQCARSRSPLGSRPKSPSSYSDTGSECSVTSTESGNVKNKVVKQSAPVASSKKGISRVPDGSSGYSLEDNQQRRKSIEKSRASHSSMSHVKSDGDREANHREKMVTKVKIRTSGDKSGERSSSRPQYLEEKKSSIEGLVGDQSVRKKVRHQDDGKVPRKPPCLKCREEARARKLARRAEKERLRAESESRQAAGRDDTRIRRSEGEGGESYADAQRERRRRDTDRSDRDIERERRQHYEHSSNGAIPKISRKHAANQEEEKGVRVKSRSSSRHKEGEIRNRSHGSSSKERQHRRSVSLDESDGNYERYEENHRKHRESSKHRKHDHPKQIGNRSHDDYDQIQDSMPANFVRRSEKYIDLSIPLENTYNYPTADQNAELLDSFLANQNEPCENDDIFEPEGAVGLDTSQYVPYPESPQPLVAPPVIMRDRSQMWKDIESGYATLPRNKSKHRRSRSSPRNSAIYEGEESESSGHHRSHSSSSRNSMLMEDAFEPSDSSCAQTASEMNCSPLRIAEPYKEKRERQKKRRSQSSSSRNSSVIEETEFDINSSTGSKDTTNRSSVGSETSSDYVPTNNDSGPADNPLENINEAAGWAENEKVSNISMNEALQLDLRGKKKSNVMSTEHEENKQVKIQLQTEENVPSSDSHLVDGAHSFVDTVENHDMMGRVVFGTSQLIDACCNDPCSSSVPYATLSTHPTPRMTYFQSNANMADVRLTPAQNRRDVENDFFSPQLQKSEKPKSATFPGRMRRRHKAGNNFDDINEFEPTEVIPDECSRSHRNESASLPRNFPHVSGRIVDNAGFEINNQISYQRSVSHMNEYSGQDEMYAIVDTTTVTLQQSLILHTRNVTTGNQPNCCVAQCSCGNPNCNLALTNGNLCTTCGAVTIGCIVHEAPPYITLPRTRADGTLETVAPNNVLLAHQNVYSTGPRHFARRPLCSVINTAPVIDPVGQMGGANLQYGFPVAQNYPPLILCSCSNSLTAGLQNLPGCHPSVSQCNAPVTVTTSDQAMLQVTQAVSTVQSVEIAQAEIRGNTTTLRRRSRPRILGPETEVTGSQQGSPRISTRQESTRTPVRAPENRPTEQTHQSDNSLMPVTLHNNIDSQSGAVVLRSGNECRSLSPDRNLMGQNLDTDSSCDESAGSCISMIQPKYSTLPWNFVCRPKKQPNTEKVKKNLPIPDRQVNTVPRRQNSARSQLKSLWQKLRKSWTRALEDESNININSSDNRVASSNQNELRNESNSNRRSRSNSPAQRNVDRVNNSELNNSPHNSPSRWSFSATWPRNFMFRRNNSNDRAQNENRSRNATPNHTRSAQNTNNEQINNQATRNFSATWPRNVTYQRNMMSWQDNDTLGYLTTVITTVTTDSVTQSSSSQSTLVVEQQSIMSSSSSESSHIGQRLVSPPGGFDFELNPAYQPEVTNQEMGNCHTDHKGRMYCPNLTHCTKQCHKNNDRKKSQDNSSGWLNVDPHGSTSQGSLSASTGNTSPAGPLSQYGSQPELEFPSERSRVPPPTPEESEQPGEAVPFSQPSIPFDFPCVDEIDPQPSCSYANTNTDQEATVPINASESEDYCYGRPPCTVGGSTVSSTSAVTETGAVSFQFNENGTQQHVAHEIHSELQCNNSHQVLTHNGFEQGHCMTYTYGMPPYFPPLQGCMDPRCMDPNCPNANMNGLPACGDPNCVDEACRAGYIYPCTDPNCTCSDMNQMCAPTGEQNMAPTLHVSTLPAYTIARPAVYGQSPTPSDKSVTFPGVEINPRPSTSVASSSSKQGNSNTSSAKSTPEKSRKTRLNKSQVKRKERVEPIKCNETDEERFNREQSFSLGNTGGIIYEVEGSLSPSSPRGLFSQSSSVNRPETYGQDSSPLSRVIPFSEIDFERSRSPKRDQQRRGSSSKDKGKSPQIKKRDRSSSQKPVKMIENAPKTQKEQTDDTRNSRARKCEEVPCSKPQVDVKKKSLQDQAQNPDNTQNAEGHSEKNTTKEKENSNTEHFLVKARKSVENCNEDTSGNGNKLKTDPKKNDKVINLAESIQKVALDPNCKVEQVSAISLKNLPLKPKPKPPLMKKIMKISGQKAKKIDIMQQGYSGDIVHGESANNSRSLKNDLICKNDIPLDKDLGGSNKIEEVYHMEIHNGNNIPLDAISAVKARSNKSELFSVIGNETRAGTGTELVTQYLEQNITGQSLLSINDKHDKSNLSCPEDGTSKNYGLIDSGKNSCEEYKIENKCDQLIGNCDLNESSNIGILYDINESNKTDTTDIHMIKGDVPKDKKIVIAQNNPGKNKLSTSRELLIQRKAIPKDSTDKANMVYTFPGETTANNFKTEPNSTNKHNQNTELLSENNSRSQKDCLENSWCEFQSKTDLSGERYCDEFEIDYRAKKNQYAPTLNTGVKSSTVKSCKMSAPNTNIIEGRSLISGETGVTKEIKGTAKSHLSALNETVDGESSSHFLHDHFPVNKNVIITDHLLIDDGSSASESKDRFISLDTDAAKYYKRQQNKKNVNQNTDYGNKCEKLQKNKAAAGLFCNKSQSDCNNESKTFIYENNNIKGINFAESEKESIKSSQTRNIKAKKEEQRSDHVRDLPFIRCPSGDSPRDIQVTVPILSPPAGTESENSAKEAAELDILDSTDPSTEYRMGTNAATECYVSTTKGIEPGKDHSRIIQRETGMFYEEKSGSPSLENYSMGTLSRKSLKERKRRHIYQDKGGISQEETSIKGRTVMELNTTGDVIGSESDVDLLNLEHYTAESQPTQYCSVNKESSGNTHVIGCKSDTHCGRFMEEKAEQGQKWENIGGLNTGIDLSTGDHSTRKRGLIGDHSSKKDRQGDNYGIIGNYNRIMDKSSSCHSNMVSNDAHNPIQSGSTANIDLALKAHNSNSHETRKVKSPGDQGKTFDNKSSIMAEKSEISDRNFLQKNVVTEDNVLDQCSDQMLKCSLKHSGYKGDTVCNSSDEDITPGTSDQSSPNLVGNLCTRIEVPHEATSSGCDFQCQNVHSTDDGSRACSSIVRNLSRNDLPICTISNCSQCASLSGNCVPSYSYDACSLCPKYSQSSTTTSVPICSCGVSNCSQTVMSTGSPVQYLDLCYCPECSTVPNCSMCHSICSIQQSNIHNCSTSDIISSHDYLPNSGHSSPTNEMSLVSTVGSQIPLYVQGLTQYSQSYSTDCYGFTVHAGGNDSQPVLDVGHQQGHDVISRSHRLSAKFTFEKLSHRTKEDLSVLLEQIREQSQVVSEELVGLLQERHNLHEQVEMRRVTIEQLVSMQGDSDSSRPPSVQMSIILPDSESSSCDSQDDDQL